jgi:6-phosphofructokinase 1
VWVVREGYEGLVRGNTDPDEKNTPEVDATKEDQPTNLLHNLRFGDGDLLRDGTSEVVGGRSLKGRYIVRVGWDDVRGWFSAVSKNVSSVFLRLIGSTLRVVLLSDPHDLNHS